MASSISSSTQIYLYHSSDLDNWQGSRAFCPVHGSDKQRSLQFTLEGEDRGFGHCHNCHAVVLLEDLNPEAARRIHEKDEREQGGVIARSPVRIRVKPPKKERQTMSYDLPLLQRYREHMVRALDYDRPRAYLEQRCIPFELAQDQGVMYLPDIPEDKQVNGLQKLTHWYDHLIFPLSSTKGQGFIGRNLHHWNPGMDEREHRDILKAKDIAPYYKSNPAGYFRFEEVVAKYPHIIIVEGVFDGLSCLVAGVVNVISLGGVALDVKMLPRSVVCVTIALDHDQTGREKSEKLKKDLLGIGLLSAEIVSGGEDGQGKDWNERYRHAGFDGLAPLLERPESHICILCIDENKETPAVQFCGDFWYCARHLPE